MANVFTSSNDVTNKPNRNVFDGSFVNHLTTKIGQITPVFCKEVIPGDSFEIDPTFGFNFAPFVFPVQTRIKANLHFFYVRNRALWRGWQDFIGKTENPDNDTEPPYIMLTPENKEMFDTGKIGDYLGIPTVLYTDERVKLTSSLSASPSLLLSSFDSAKVSDINIIEYTGRNGFSENMSMLMSHYYPKTWDSIGAYISENTKTLALPYKTNSSSVGYYKSVYLKSELSRGVVEFRHSFPTLLKLVANTNYLGRNTVEQLFTNPDDPELQSDLNEILVVAMDSSGKVVSGFSGSIQSPDSFTAPTSRTAHFFNCSYGGNNELIYDLTSGSGLVTFNVFISRSIGSNIDANTNFNVLKSTYYAVGSYGIENKYRHLQDLPFMSTADEEYKMYISAMPFRAVDAVYNSFYRDIRNNPYIRDGKPYYNVWVDSQNGGPDTKKYELYRANWEKDVFTTAVQSPQQGIAPLVGVTSTGLMTFQDEEGNTYTAQATYAEDGDTITGISTHSPDMPVGTLRALVDTISSGISISDFRNVNAYQVWLERNMRKGLRYKDQIEVHFGVSPTYSELQMPEFIGGVSRVVDMNAVVQTSDSGNSSSPLGSLAGRGNLFGNGQTISKFCDEHGYIIGFISFVPVPVYSQNIPKHLLKNERFDYYFPEFANIGFQPILNCEVSPLQCDQSVTGKHLDDVFGYQRAWYDYLQNLDEAHGDFRSSMRDYLIQRIYNGLPVLGKDFLTVSPDEANDVFAVQDDSDKIFGMIHFDVKMKRPIPRHGIPSLLVD